jgi:hypothetical protein
MTNTNLSNREINKLTRDGGNGRNVYLVSPTGACYRVTRARTHKGNRQVRDLNSGKWLYVMPSDTFMVR